MLDTVTNWLTNIDPTIWGSLIAGGMTLCGVVLGQFAIHRRREQQKEDEIEALCAALIAEVASMETHMLVRVADKIQNLGTREERTTQIIDEVQKTFERNGDEELSKAIPGNFLEDLSDQGAQLLAVGHTNVLIELTTIDMSTQIYDANVDKIGRLDISDIRTVIEYYKRIHKVQQTVGSIVDALESQEENMDVSRFGGRLRAQANGLAEQQERALRALGADEEAESVSLNHDQSESDHSESNEKESSLE